MFDTLTEIFVVIVPTNLSMALLPAGIGLLIAGIVDKKTSRLRKWLLMIGGILLTLPGMFLLVLAATYFLGGEC